jgi:outer membrane protein OmpA-like peptidoglycan-associated protein
VAGALTGFSLLGATAAGAVTTTYVGPGGGSGGCATPAYSTIAAGIVAAGAGGNVFVCAGTYTENLTIPSADAGLTIQGAGQGSTFVEPQNSDPAGYSDITPGEFGSTVFLVQANDVTIEDLTINGSNPGATTSPAPLTAGAPCDTSLAAYGEDGGCGPSVVINAGAGIDTGVGSGNGGTLTSPVTNLSVQAVTVENVYQVGIANRSPGGTFNISNDTITNVGGLFGQGIFTFQSSGTIADNSVSWTGEAIQGNWGQFSVTGNTIVGSNYGVFLGNIGEVGGGYGSSTISNNNISNCWGQSFFGGASNGDSELGIALFATYYPTAQTVSHNDVTGCSTGLADFASNSDSADAAPVVTFSNNSVDVQNLSGGIGALVSTDELGFNHNPVDAQFTDNSITNAPTALYTDETSLDNWANAGDTPLPGGLTVTASGNDFDGAWFNDATGSISATDNWWGSVAGPSVTIGSPDAESSSALISRGASTWWTSPNETPSAPRGVTAAGLAKKATVSWTAPQYTGNTDPSVTITGYTVTASPGGNTCTTASLSCTVSGLSNKTTYSFSVAASNTAGAGPSASTSATTATTPGAPQSVMARAGNSSVTVSWSAPSSDGGSAVTKYKVTSKPGSKSCSTTSLSCTVFGLTNGTSYTFTVTATNAAGTGPSSNKSSARIPVGVTGIAPFGYGSAQLSKRLDAQVQALAVSLKADSNADVSLVGYTNPGEGHRSLSSLGLARATAVGTYLASLLSAEGVTGITITESYGGNSTIAPAGSSMNRRVAATIS